MSDEPRGRAKRAGVLTVLGAVGLVAAGIAAERVFVRRDRRRPDPFKDEPYGSIRGKPIGPVETSDGTLIHVEEAGSGPVTLVLSHGFSLNSALWHHQIKGLADDARLVMLDHRGHGRSARAATGDWGLDALAQDIDAVVRATTKDEPVVLVGHSMGGMAVLHYCEAFPEMIGTRVRGLVLADTTSADVMSGMMPGVARRIEALMQGLQEAAMRALQGRADSVDRFRMNGNNIGYIGARFMGFGPKPSPTQVMWVDRMLAETPSDVWVSLIPAMYAFDLIHALPSITVPVLIIVGEHDRLTPPHAAERMAAALPDSELVVLEGAGHTSMAERPDEFNEHLRAFIARVQRS